MVIQFVRKYVLKILLISFLVLWVIGMVMQHTPSGDLFWMVSTGDYIIENHEIPQINPFTIHENFKIIIQQWLWCVIMSKVYCLAELNGIAILHLMLTILFSLIAYSFTKELSSNKKSQSVAFFTLLILVCRQQAKFINRPQYISFMIIMLMIILLEKYKASKNQIYLAILPIVSVFAANMHSAFIPVELVLIASYAIKDEISKECRNPIKLVILSIKENYKIIITLILMLLFSMINPYGMNNVLYLLKSYGNINGDNKIGELAVPDIKSFESFLVIASIILLISYIRRNKHDLKSRYLYLSVITIIFGVMHYRNSWLVVVGNMPIYINFIDSIKIELKENIKDNLTLVALFILSILNVVFIIVLPKTDIELKDTSLYPIKAVEYLDKNCNKYEIILYNDFNSGGYLEKSGYKVYIDQRPEIYDDEINGVKDVYDEYWEIVSSNEVDKIEEFIESYNFTHLLVRKQTALYVYLISCGKYDNVVDGDGYGMFIPISN